MSPSLYELPRSLVDGRRQMNPSRFQLPQFVSDDLKRARAETLLRARQRYVPKRETPEGGEQPGFRALPISCTKLPREADFTSARFAELGLNSVWSQVNGVLATSRAVLEGLFTPSRSGAKARVTARQYRAIFRVLSPPNIIMQRWHEDAEFGRQRLTGVNPMHLRRLRERLEGHERLWEAATYELRQRGQAIEDVLGRQQLFYLEYPDLVHPLVQKHLRPGAHLAAPVCYFWVDGLGNLMPLAIQLKPATVREKNPVFTPSSPYYDWMMARAHVQAADSHVHEGTYHLLETHLVSGAVVMALYRHVHPDHPLRQLVDPHFKYTLAINELALGGLLATDGTIDNALAAGVQGTLNAARLFYARWSFFERTLDADLEARGVGDGDTLPFYYYRDDARQVYRALRTYVSAMLSLWYCEDRDVEADYELQAWVAELSSEAYGLPGFPKTLRTCEELHRLVTELLFRAGPQHAAVNNGQFDGYGWIPNMPGLSVPLPDEVPVGGIYSQQDYWNAMPSMKSSLNQMGMVWVLSVPTLRTLMHSGEAPAFHPSLCAEAEQLISGFRRQLASISNDIERRNQTLDIPYRYLDPQNISRSTDI